MHFKLIGFEDYVLPARSSNESIIRYSQVDAIHLGGLIDLKDDPLCAWWYFEIAEFAANRVQKPYPIVHRRFHLFPAPRISETCL